jgi:exopolysaccharide biosynthesis polyprenyl glycosylphosphotransferase
VIIGANRVGYELAKSLQRNRHLGYVLRGFVDDTAESNGFKVLGRTDDLINVIRAEYVDEVFLVPPYSPELLSRIAAQAQRSRTEVKIVPAFVESVAATAGVDYIDDLPVLSLWRKPFPASALFVKRVLDVALSVIGLVVAAPLFAFLAVAIKVDSPGPVFYIADRVGRKGQRFRCYKLRTMLANADELKEELRRGNERRGAFFKIECDPRITRLGRVLRKYSLDELPQIWNVLQGQMSLVGPRPHPVDDFANYTLEDRRRLEVRPGITGLWQIMGRRDPSFERSMALDLEYIEKWSLALDFKILLKTLPAVLRGTGQ